MDFGPYKFEMREGWPPDGEPGQFFGFDAEMNVAVLRWLEGEWHGIRFQFYDQPRHPISPEFFRRGEGTEQYVVQWAAAPWAQVFEDRCTAEQAT